MSAPPVGSDSRPAGPKSLGRSTALFAVWTGVSRIAGLVREIAASTLFGTKGPINAFVIAFTVPNLLRSLVADAALSAAFVPVFTELQEQGRHREARRLAGALIGLISLVLGVVSVLAIVLAPAVMPVFAPGLPDDLMGDLVLLSQIMFPIVVLLGLTGLVAGILQAAGEFGPTAFVPVLWNAVILVGLLMVAPLVEGDGRIYVYAVAILVGTVAQLLYLLPYLRGKGPFPLSFGLGNPHIKRVLILMLPVTIALGLINVNASVDGIFATLVSEEAPRAIDAAFRLYILPQGVFSVAISTVLFPTISRLVARGDIDELRRTVADGLRLIFFMLAPATAFLMILDEQIVRLVFEHGEFDEQSTALTSEALFFFTIGLAFNGASLLLIRTFFSLQRPWRPTAVAFLGVVLNALLDLALYVPLGVGGIPLATSIASIVTFLVLARLLDREIRGLEGERVLNGVMRSVLASGVMALLAWTSWRALDDALGRGLLAQMVSLGAALVAGTVAYFAAAQAFDLPELRLLARLRRPLR